MDAPDLLSLGALLVSILSALYARHANSEAKRANAASLHWQQRPLRLEVYRSMFQFAQFCSTYFTMWHLKAVNGTRDLTSRIDSFKWEIAQHGPLNMPEVEALQGRMISSAWNMQRLIDRIAGGHHESMDAAFVDADEHLHHLISWFASERDGLVSTFGGYLTSEPSGNGSRAGA